MGRWEFTQEGNEIGSESQLAYDLSGGSFSNSQQVLLLNYETRNQNRSDKLASLIWRYRSQARAIDGNRRWEVQLGYGIGSQGSGLIASLGTTVVPGLLLRGLYQGVSLTSAQPSFTIELVSSLNFQQGITAGDRRAETLRTLGGLLINRWETYFSQHHQNRLGLTHSLCKAKTWRLLRASQ